MLERPYIVCDRCGHQWTADVEEPSECENCRARALWAFPSPEAADDHSQLVLDRRGGDDRNARLVAMQSGTYRASE